MDSPLNEKPRESHRKRDRRKFEDLAALAGETFNDYLIIARTEDGGMRWRASNGTWASGAAGTFLDAQRKSGSQD